MLSIMRALKLAKRAFRWALAKWLVILSGALGLGWCLAIGLKKGAYSSELAAWVQAFGSILAILAAIHIDRGQQRRDLATAQADRAAQIGSWRAALGEAADIMANAHRLNQRDLDRIDETRIERLLRNTHRMLTVYLQQTPPDPNLAWVLAAAKTEYALTLKALKRYRVARQLVPDLEFRAAVEHAADNLEALCEEYDNGLL